MPDLSPFIVAVTRTPIDKKNVSLIPLNPDGSLMVEPTIDQVIDWFSDWVKAFDPAILGVMPEKPVYIYYLHLEITEKHTTEVNVFIPETRIDPPTEVYKLPINTPNQTVSQFAISFFNVTTAVVIDEVSVFLPDMAGLETFNAIYQRNALLMGISLQLNLTTTTFIGPISYVTESTSGTTLPFPVWLPGPMVGSPLITKQNQERNNDEHTIEFGDPDLSKTNDEYISNYLGLEFLPGSNKDVKGARIGEIRWYDFFEFPLTVFEKIKFNLFNFLHASKTGKPGQLVIALPENIAKEMEAFRTIGKLLSSTFWSDNNVIFNVPKNDKGIEDAGWAILWRDDIPSKPVFFGDVLGYVQTKVLELAQQLWQPKITTQPDVLEVHIPLGELVEIGVERLVDSVNNLLANAIDNPLQTDHNTTPLSVQFAFKVVNQSPKFDPKHLLESTAKKVIDQGYMDGFEPGSVGVSVKKVSFQYLPEISETELSPEQSGAFSLQLSVRIGGDINLWGETHTIKPFELAIGLPILFIPEPLIIPTIAIFFYDHFFQGPALVGLPKDTGLFGKDDNGKNIEIHIDADTQNQFVIERAAVTSKLSAIHTLLNIYNKLAKEEDKTIQFVTKLIGILNSIGMSVIDSSGNIEDLGSCLIAHRTWPLGDITFRGSITSMIMIGVPYKYCKTVVRCYQNLAYNKDKKGVILEFVLPGDNFIAAIPSFWNLHSWHTIKADGEEIKIPLPYGDPTLGQPTPPDDSFIEFNDKVGSMKFENDKKPIP
jgi:hypothetical protein